MSGPFKGTKQTNKHEPIRPKEKTGDRPTSQRL